MVELYLQPVVEPSKRLCARDIATKHGMCYQRAYFIFEKWIGKGWYECGVNLGLGWLTSEGKGVAGGWLLEGS